MATKKCTTCGKTRKMTKGGSVGCPPGYYVENVGGPCIKIPKTFDGPSVKVAGAILGTGISALGAKVGKNISDKRQEKKAIKKTVDDTAKKVTSNVMKKGGWIDSAIKKPGALREQLGVKKGEKIPKAKLAAAAKKGGKLGQRARLAITLSKMSKK